MHLLLINYEYPPIGGGAGNATRYNAEWLAREHQVTVLTSRFGDLPHDERDGNLRIIRVPSMRRRQDRSNTAEMMVFMFHAGLAVDRIWRESRPDATIAFFGIPGGPPAWWLLKRRRVPYIVALRGGDVPGFQRDDLQLHHLVATPFIRYLWRQAAAVVANSQGLADLARESAVGVDIGVVPNGVDTEHFHPPAAPAEGPLSIVFTGRLVHQKGVDILLQALAALRPAAPALHVIGDGPLRAELTAQVAALGLADQVTFHGWVERTAIPAIMGRSHLFVLASRDEGMPNAVLEAMACGLPVIATQIPGCDELIVPGETGWLVPAQDPAALAEAIRDADADRTRLQRYGVAGRARITEHYSWENSADLYVDLVRGILGR